MFWMKWFYMKKNVTVHHQVLGWTPIIWELFYRDTMYSRCSDLMIFWFLADYVMLLLVIEIFINISARKDIFLNISNQSLAWIILLLILNDTTTLILLSFMLLTILNYFYKISMLHIIKRIITERKIQIFFHLVLVGFQLLIPLYRYLLRHCLNYIWLWQNIIKK